MITIAKASAGSGKTYTLARTYISILLKSEEPYPYRHILAVTFTNKATAEMKARILRELDILAHAPEESPYYRDFVPSLQPDAPSLRRRCAQLLNGMLHDYGAFSVFTIDKFFQQVLRAFARELGQFESYNLELDKSSVVGESVDRMLEGLSDKDGALVGWLKESVMDQISSKGYFQLEDTLYSAANDLQSQEFREYLAGKGISDPAVIYSRKNMSALRQTCDGLIAKFTGDVRSRAEALLGMFRAGGIELSETYRKFALSPMNACLDASPRRKLEAPGDAFRERILDRELLFSKANAGRAALLPSGFEAAARSFLALFFGEGEDGFNAYSPYFKAYRTAFQIRDMIYGLGIWRELSDSFSELLKEKNLLCLEDSNTLLNRIIDGSDVPFVYEKTGVRYEHFLLDEFQDTSVVQWDNFRPLLRESDSNGNDSLIVGDVKQSIYRWRQSDWNLLDSGVGAAFPSSRQYLGTDGRPALSVNYRTEENIVGFNNLFFESLRDRLAARFRADGAEEWGRVISRIYSDVRQDAARKGGSGAVRLCFSASAKSPDGGDPVLEKTVSGIMELHNSKGVSYGDIAVVVRRNSPGEKIANRLMDMGVPVISDDSLTVGNSIVVRRIVSVLASVENPENKASGYLAASIGFVPEEGWSSITGLAESIIRKLRDNDPHLVESHSLYIQAFMDRLQSYVARNGNRLRDFLRDWEEKNDKTPLKIASPSSTDAVRIITIHKAKGLEFPYMFIPYFEDIEFFSPDKIWAEPSVPSEPAANAAMAEFNSAVKDGIFKPVISDASRQTYFENTYNQERLYQCIDALNLMYVAMTRPSLWLEIICGKTSSAFRKDSSCISNAADALCAFALEQNLPVTESDWGLEYSVGEFCTASEAAGRRKNGGKPRNYVKESSQTVLRSAYPSYPLVSARLRVGGDAADFFSSDGSVGMEASRRLRGIVLHGILSSVIVPDDLEGAVSDALDSGELTEAQAKDAYSLLKDRITAAQSRGWFTESRGEVLNERPVVTAGGDALRPDRVSIRDGKVLIIDYKFGRQTPSHGGQVQSYMDVYRSLGYSSVRGFLWYVAEDRVIEVCPAGSEALI